MVTSAAATVDAYLAELPPERREVAAALRALIRRHLPAGYAEAMTWGMPTYEVPLARYPDTYNKKPLAYVGFAAQKQKYSLYLMGVYADSVQERSLREAAAAMGTTLDMGKCCLRFASLDRLPQEAIGKLIASLSVDDFIAMHEAARVDGKPRSAGRAKAAAKPGAAAKAKSSPNTKTASKRG
jgi:uncharacterized protein YdhG (YjbR/CyaY superfamily)